MSNIELNLAYILSARYGKDVRLAIHDAIRDCYEDGKAGAIDLIAREQIADTDEKLSAQIANLVANAPSGSEKDSELVDIRVGYKGTTYQSAGEAVRGQIGKLSEEKVGGYKFITSSAQLSSLAEAEPNRIYVIGIGLPDTLPDFPEEGKQYGTLVTLNHSSSENDGTIQIFGSESRSKFFIRQSWQGVFGKWYQINFDIGSITNLKSELSNLKSELSNLKSELSNLKNDLSEYVKKSDISMFESVGVIGDSYASGGMVINGKIVVSYGISWPQVLKRKTGVKFVNYSFAGATCKTWISNSSYGLEKLKSDDKRDLYCICMGINDADRQETEPTGTIDDIKDNYEENPDTFFGNMGKIISEIKLKSEKSKIILFTIPKKQSQYVEYSGYIKQIAGKFGLPCADSLTDQFLSSDDYQNNMSGGHPLAVGYSGMANSMENLIENSMLDSYFNDYTGNI